MRAPKSPARAPRLGKCAKSWRACMATVAIVTASAGCKDSGHAPKACGDFGESRLDARMLANEERIQLRIRLEAPMSIQAAPVSHLIYVDLDGRERTGFRGRGAPLEGADLLVELSPRDEQRPGALREGVAVYRLDGAGRRTPSGHADFDLRLTPTHAAREIEVSARRPEGTKGGAPRGRILVQNAGGDVVDCTGALRAAPAFAKAPPAMDRIPPPEGGGLRIVSYNVYLGSPMKNPAPFARTLRALEPDIVLLQEWTDARAEDIDAWFEKYVPSATGWSVVAGAAWGVAVASRYPLERLGPERIPPPIPAAGTNASEEALRLTGAIAHAPLGPVAVASVHLKCCGGMGSAEDLRRIAEASLVRDTLREALAGRAVALRIVGGDFNLQGARLPLELMGVGLDGDATALTQAETPVLGTRASYTWRDPRSNLLPGRLDYVLVGDDALAIERGFALDTARLSPSTLASAGLLPDDTGASDHLPLVIDVRQR
ncbi:endonuclease/exonuclease/phosphatase family protein [Polyangium aurulentum]|uniref:endonuclease/exonuclease/phosphatase family protein n=1 Tax=Polyangium aurulentum TaxID=2567896 RepID=UPI0010ADD6F4|nr:endonuclease/exonuclease/phosphatase family protein [Polyangium aurulentum]UQA54716.1 endonuclease/exonuclease/phosphatase family protein [Polyangium aurulentum]